MKNKTSLILIFVVAVSNSKIEKILRTIKNINNKISFLINDITILQI